MGNFLKASLGLPEILGNLVGCTPNSSNMISLLQANCAFRLNHLSLEDEFSLGWRKPILSC